MVLVLGTLYESLGFPLRQGVVDHIAERAPHRVIVGSKRPSVYAGAKHPSFRANLTVDYSIRPIAAPCRVTRIQNQGVGSGKQLQSVQIVRIACHHVWHGVRVGLMSVIHAPAVINIWSPKNKGIAVCAISWAKPVPRTSIDADRSAQCGHCF